MEHGYRRKALGMDYGHKRINKNLWDLSPEVNRRLHINEVAGRCYNHLVFFFLSNTSWNDPFSNTRGISTQLIDGHKKFYSCSLKKQTNKPDSKHER